MVAWSNQWWIVALCAVRFCGPKTAAARVPWLFLHDWRDDTGAQALVHALEQADREWAREFIEVASALPMSGTHYSMLTTVLRAALIHHRLPSPSGHAFYLHWRAGGPAARVPTGDGPGVDADLMASDPLMPELLFGYLASGHCGQDLWLPAVVGVLVERGAVDRQALLDCVLSLLTSPQRPKSQAVLARITASAELRANEVPGGLTYLLGVMATSPGEVSGVLLALAIDSIATGADLVALTTVIVGRKERKQKKDLLHAVTTDDICRTVGDESVAVALSLLADSDDTAFVARVDRARRRLGFEPVSSQHLSPTTGLWDLEPTAVPSRRIPNDRRQSTKEQSWCAALDSSHAYTDMRTEQIMGDEILTDMANGELDSTLLVGIVRDLLEKGSFSAVVFTRVFGDLFLAGGLQQGWPVALEVADAACAAPRRPAGLHLLLAMLASVAHEVPEQAMPPAISMLAAERGETKLRVEARRLGASLVRGAASASAPRSTASSARGLWRDDRGVTPLPSQRRVTPASHDLDRLRTVLDQEYLPGATDVCFVPSQHSRQFDYVTLTSPEIALAATVRAVNEHGQGAVRSALVGITRQYPAMDVIAAIDYWVAGHLSFESYWQTARLPSDYDAVERSIRRGGPTPSVCPSEVLETLNLPYAAGTPSGRLSFLRACESLLLAEAHPVVLATPTWADGTLDITDLIARLRSLDGGAVGPLDLIQALYRLREVDLADLADLADVGSLQDVRTSARLTSPEGEETWDVVEIVGEWVAAGGLPPLVPVLIDNEWTTQTAAPVTWSRCAALPELLRADPWCWSINVPTQVRLMPRWADRTIRIGHYDGFYFEPMHVPGLASAPLGEPFHDQALALLGGAPNGSNSRKIEVLLDLAQRDRFDATLSARAALGRHAAGALALGRLSQGIADVVAQGGLRGMWPSALAIAAALLEVPAKPSGLPQLLRLLTSYVPDVPNPQTPPTLRRFAESAGSTRSHHEARALVAALDRR